MQVLSRPRRRRVAVFSQPGFQYYGPTAHLAPRQIAADLRTAASAADELDADALADPARFNARTYAALVLPYGNDYPQVAFPNLRAFHRAGGCLVLTGIPFTHPLARDAKGDWQDLGHNPDPGLVRAGRHRRGRLSDGPAGAVSIAAGDRLALTPLMSPLGPGLGPGRGRAGAGPGDAARRDAGRPDPDGGRAAGRRARPARRRRF